MRQAYERNLRTGIEKRIGMQSLTGLEDKTFSEFREKEMRRAGHGGFMQWAGGAMDSAFQAVGLDPFDYRENYEKKKQVDRDIRGMEDAGYRVRPGYDESTFLNEKFLKQISENTTPPQRMSNPSVHLNPEDGGV